MPSSAVSLVSKLLANTSNPSVIESLVSPTATYISLNFSDPPLQKIMPWCGTHTNAGPAAIIETFANVDRHWENKDFTIQTIFGDENGNVACFGSFTYMGRVTGITKTSPFAVWSKVEMVEGEEKVSFMQFMEDTFATASTFEVGGEKRYRADPDGGEVVL